MKLLGIYIVLPYLITSAIFNTRLRVSSTRKFKQSSLVKLIQNKNKKDIIAAKQEYRKHGVVSRDEMRSLERKFETIKDLGSIFKCKIHNSETLVTGDHFLCDGKRFQITPEAARDIERPGSTRQGIMQSPEGEPQDLVTTFHGGIYGQPLASFLGEPYEMARSGYLQPHDKYPILGIYDPGMRSLDSQFTARTNIVPMTANSNNRLHGGFEDSSDGQPTSASPFQPRNFGGMELGDISQAMQFDENDDLKQYGDYEEPTDNFYRDSRMQMDAFGMNGVSGSSNNPFGQYWKSLKTNFYGTTASQLGQQDPSANSRETIYEKAEMKTKIPTKKSNIQLKEAAIAQSDKKRSIPIPHVAAKSQDLNSVTAKSKGDKRYLIFGQQFPMNMYHDVPTFNPMQYYARQQHNNLFTPYNNPPFARFNEQYRPSFNFAPQRGFARSFSSSPYSQGWGLQGETSQSFDPYLAGGISHAPLDRLFAQMRSQEVGGEPGHPRKGVMQYGIQPNTKRPPFLGYVPVPIMQPMPLNYQGADNTMVNEGDNFEPSSPEETLQQASSRSTFSRNDASREYESLTDPQTYLPAPMYRPPSYNPHETEDFFPEGTNQKNNEDENKYLQENSLNRNWEREQTVDGNEKSAANLYQDEVDQEQQINEEGARKRAIQQETHLNIHGNKIDREPDGKMMFTKDHVGFGPITVEAKTAHSAMKDPSDDDDK